MFTEYKPVFLTDTKQLFCFDVTLTKKPNIEWFLDEYGCEGITYNEKQERYEMNSKIYDYWNDYFCTLEKIEEVERFLKPYFKQRAFRSLRDSYRGNEFIDSDIKYYEVIKNIKDLLEEY